jgi:hypothetical protein
MLSHAGRKRDVSWLLGLVHSLEGHSPLPRAADQMPAISLDVKIVLHDARPSMRVAVDKN